MRLSSTASCVVERLWKYTGHTAPAFLVPNLGGVSEEHREHFHQDIEATEERCHRRSDTAITDFTWCLVRRVEHRRSDNSESGFELGLMS